MEDRKRYGLAVLMSLSNAFNKINYDLLLNKLHAYGFTNESQVHKKLCYKLLPEDKSKCKL